MCSFPSPSGGTVERWSHNVRQHWWTEPSAKPASKPEFHLPSRWLQMELPVRQSEPECFVFCGNLHCLQIVPHHHPLLVHFLLSCSDQKFPLQLLPTLPTDIPVGEALLAIMFINYSNFSLIHLHSNTHLLPCT